MDAEADIGSVKCQIEFAGDVQDVAHCLIDFVVTYDHTRTRIELGSQRSAEQEHVCFTQLAGLPRIKQPRRCRHFDQVNAVGDAEQARMRRAVFEDEGLQQELDVNESAASLFEIEHRLG